MKKRLTRLIPGCIAFAGLAVLLYVTAREWVREDQFERAWEDYFSREYRGNRTTALETVVAHLSSARDEDFSSRIDAATTWAVSRDPEYLIAALGRRGADEVAHRLRTAPPRDHFSADEVVYIKTIALLANRPIDRSTIRTRDAPGGAVEWVVDEGRRRQTIEELLTWWEDHRAQEPEEWLIPQLSDPAHPVREGAARWLQLLYGTTLGYQPDLSTEQRDALRKLWGKQWQSMQRRLAWKSPSG